MRDDMHRVLVTRPRVGGKVPRKGRMRRMDDPPPRVGMKRTLALTKADRKALNEHLQPLRRYLLAQVGRPWNKVWSDISATLRATSAVQQHVRDHVFDFVAKDVSLGGYDLWVCQYGRARPLRESTYELWVDPRTGILRHNRHRVTWRQTLRERRAQASRELRARMVPGKGNVQYHLLADGAWWEVTLANHAEVPPPDGVKPIDAVLDARLSPLPPRKLYGREGVHAVEKRQLSRREAARLGLGTSRAAHQRLGRAVWGTLLRLIQVAAPFAENGGSRLRVVPRAASARVTTTNRLPAAKLGPARAPGSERRLRCREHVVIVALVNDPNTL